jgi:hypothetical protein
MATGHSGFGAFVGCLPEASCHRIRNTTGSCLVFQTISGESTGAIRAHHHRLGRHGSNAAGLKVRDTCAACRYRDYTIAEPARLIDAACWDGSDLFIVWPLPLYRFASDRLAGILRAEKTTGAKLIPAAEIPFERGNVASPGLLHMWMPASRSRSGGTPRDQLSVTTIRAMNTNF